MSTERDQIVNLTKSLVEIPSVTGVYDEAVRALKFVDGYLTQENLISQTYEHVNKKGQTIVSQLWGDKNTFLTPKLLLSGHLDVLSASQKQFVPEESDGKLYGRGAGDMKGHVASMLLAYKKWLSDNGSPRGVGLLLTSDEEEGSFDGARYVIEQAKLRPNTVFIPDGEFSFDIVDSQKAPHHFHVRARSETKGGHVSLAFKKDNPVNKILTVYNEMRKKYSIATTTDEWKSTFEMTVIKTGNGDNENGRPEVENAANGIPEWADAWFGWRWPLEIEIDNKKATYDTGLADLQKISKKYGVSVLEDDHGFGEGCYTNPNSKFVQTWKGIIQPIIGHEVGFKHMHGSTDGRHFYKYGSQVLVTSGITEGAHSSNEWVDIDSLVKLSEAIYRYQKEMTK